MSEQLLNYEQASNLLQVHQVTLRRLVSKRKISFLKIGRSECTVAMDRIQAKEAFKWE